MSEDMRSGRPSRFGQQIDRLLSGTSVEQTVADTRELVHEVRDGLERVSARVSEQGEQALDATREIAEAIDALGAQLLGARNQVSTLLEQMDTVRALREELGKLVEAVARTGEQLEPVGAAVDEALAALSSEVRRLASHGGVDGVLQAMQADLGRTTQQIGVRLDAVEQVTSQLLLEIRDNTARFAAGETPWIGELAQQAAKANERTRGVEKQVRAVEAALGERASELAQTVQQSASRSRREVRELTDAVSAGSAKLDDVLARIDALAHAQARIDGRLESLGRRREAVPAAPERTAPPVAAPEERPERTARETERRRLLRRLVRKPKEEAPVVAPSVEPLPLPTPAEQETTERASDAVPSDLRRAEPAGPSARAKPKSSTPRASRARQAREDGDVKKRTSKPRARKAPDPPAASDAGEGTDDASGV